MKVFSLLFTAVLICSAIVLSSCGGNDPVSEHQESVAEVSSQSEDPSSGSENENRPDNDLVSYEEECLKSVKSNKTKETINGYVSFYDPCITPKNPSRLSEIAVGENDLSYDTAKSRLADFLNVIRDRGWYKGGAETEEWILEKDDLEKENYESQHGLMYVDKTADYLVPPRYDEDEYVYDTLMLIYDANSIYSQIIFYWPHPESSPDFSSLCATDGGITESDLGKAAENLIKTFFGEYGWRDDLSVRVIMEDDHAEVTFGVDYLPDPDDDELIYRVNHYSVEFDIAGDDNDVNDVKFYKPNEAALVKSITVYFPAAITLGEAKPVVDVNTAWDMLRSGAGTVVRGNAPEGMNYSNAAVYGHKLVFIQDYDSDRNVPSWVFICSEKGDENILAVSVPAI